MCIYLVSSPYLLRYYFIMVKQDMQYKIGLFGNFCGYQKIAAYDQKMNGYREAAERNLSPESRNKPLLECPNQPMFQLKKGKWSNAPLTNIGKRH